MVMLNSKFRCSFRLIFIYFAHLLLLSLYPPLHFSSSFSLHDLSLISLLSLVPSPSPSHHSHPLSPPPLPLTTPSLSHHPPLPLTTPSLLFLMKSPCTHLPMMSISRVPLAQWTIWPNSSKITLPCALPFPTTLLITL